VLPFHRAVVDDPAFAPSDPTEAFLVHTRWIETEFVNTIPPFEGADGVSALADGANGERETITVEVGGKRLEVRLPANLSSSESRPGNTARRQRKQAHHSGALHGDALTAPMQGTIVKVAVSEGQHVDAGDLIVVLEAMKMEQPLLAHTSGTITNLTAQAGQTIATGATVCEIKSE
jgi:acetyl-CoA/propionyl-CoA carboxylase, biotin carboxylase, biotin carboxyl carrier protein